jgi:tetratricopeptide (TPR) repeat protein
MGGRSKLLAVALYVLCAVSASLVSEVLLPVGEASDLSVAQPVRADHTIAQTLLGQLRVTLDKYFWLRTEDYLHFGISYHSYTRVKLERSMMADVQTTTAGLIPGQARRAHVVEKDWRGVFKHFDFLQPVKGYHGDPTELLPWYRAQTALNPLDTSAYVNGAFFLADLARRPAEALEFLKEGAQNNPNSIEIQQAIGQLYYDKWKMYDDAIPPLEKAISLGKQKGDRAEAEEKAFGEAYLFLARAHRDKGDLESALRIAEEGVGECPDDPLVRAIHRIVRRDMEEGQAQETVPTSGHGR